MLSPGIPSFTMYQVIARKYRPQSFNDVVNQDHIKTTLRNAIAQNRIAHGYIFSGQRGTGKTTTARILARCLNCVNGPTESPCGVCSSCREIAAGEAVDVIEIDAASNRGIDNMRELRENVRYQPQRDRFKIFIIDEAHQITSEAFNALLKTIEEPPAWVVFILCTTESHKIPATIASRCQHFSFRSVDYNDLVDLMRRICAEEGIEADDDSLFVIAQSGEGSVRDSLSALDQAIACCGNKLEADAVRALLGAYSINLMSQVTEALAASDGARMLAIVDELERNGQNLQHFSRELSRYFRNLLVARLAGADSRLLAASPREREEMVRISSGFSEDDLTRYLQIALNLFSDLQFSLQPRFHLEIGLLKMIQAGKLLEIEQALADLGPAARTAATPAAAAPRPAPPPTRPAPPPQRTVAAPARPQAPPHAPDPDPAPDPSASTGDLRERLHGALTELGMAFTADAVEHSQVTQSGNEIQILAPAEMRLAMTEADLQKAVAHLRMPRQTVKITFGDPGNAGSALEKKKPDEDEVTTRALADPEVQRYRELFGGEIRTVRNLKE